MNFIHPVKYVRAFSSQLSRLERLYPDITTSNYLRSHDPKSIEIEHIGASVEELRSRNERLQHLESLIADWQVDGENVFRAASNDGGAEGGAGAIRLDDIPPCVAYIDFGSDPALSFVSIPKARIEGCYIREVVYRGRVFAELTLVCDELGWTTMDSCLYVDAMAVGARIGVGLLPIEVDIPTASASHLFEGDADLLGERAFVEALGAVEGFVASCIWRRPTSLASINLAVGPR